MALTEATNRPVTLEEVLASREARAERQKLFLAKGIGAVLSFTIVTPGPIKDSDDARLVFAEGLAALTEAAAERDVAIVARQDLLPVTGPESFWFLAALPMSVKAMAVGIEVRHPLGRLFDMDVLDANGVPIPRCEIGAPPRNCLLCDNPAAVCARSRAHDLAELTEAVGAMVVARRTITQAR